MNVEVGVGYHVNHDHRPDAPRRTVGGERAGEVPTSVKATVQLFQAIQM